MSGARTAPRPRGTSMRSNVPLARYTTFRIGGPARLFCEPVTEDELREVCLLTHRRRRWPVYILGGGSNVLIGDDGLDGLVICMRRFESRYLRRFGNLVRVSAGVPLQRLVRTTAAWGLSGLEALAGVPGTVGGAVSMNAGGRETCIGERVSFVEVMDATGRTERLSGAEVAWGYRSADLGGRVVTFAEVELRSDSPEAVGRRVSDAFARKRASQPLSLPSAGCFFKNPSIGAAGMLLDRAGLKGLESGGAAVSRKHANFIVNRGGATAADVLALAATIMRAIRDLFHVVLEPEVCVWP